MTGDPQIPVQIGESAKMVLLYWEKRTRQRPGKGRRRDERILLASRENDASGGGGDETV